MSKLALTFASALVFAVGCSSNSDDTSGGGGSGASSASTGSGNTEPANMMGMTAAHNEVRANVMPAAATPIPDLVWSGDVAAVAQAYAEKCVFMHSGGKYGENLFATTGQSTPVDVVAAWAGEVNDYDYATNSCTAVCGHYTQVVWAASARLGCGVANCTENSPFGSGSWQNWVCNYDPPGNYVGQKPY